MTVPGSTPTVLVVDDERSSRARRTGVGRRRVQGDGGRRGNGGAARHRTRGGFSVYILDVMLPGVRGTELAREIRTRYPTAKILYFTAFSHALFTTADRVLRDDEAFLQKPVSNRELLEAVSLLLFGHIKGRTRRARMWAAKVLIM